MLKDKTLCADLEGRKDAEVGGLYILIESGVIVRFIDLFA